MNEQEHMDWDRFEEGVSIILKGAQHLETPDFIYSIPKGGLVLGVRLCHRIREKAKLVTNLEDFAEESEDLSGKFLWIVDDISDTGKTLKNSLSKAIKRFKRENVKIITLYKKTGTAAVPDICAFEVPDSRWIVFPWEKK